MDFKSNTSNATYVCKNEKVEKGFHGLDLLEESVNIDTDSDFDLGFGIEDMELTLPENDLESFDWETLGADGKGAPEEFLGLAMADTQADLSYLSEDSDSIGVIVDPRTMEEPCQAHTIDINTKSLIPNANATVNTGSVLNLENFLQNGDLIVASFVENEGVQLSLDAAADVDMNIQVGRATLLFANHTSNSRRKNTILPRNIVEENPITPLESIPAKEVTLIQNAVDSKPLKRLVRNKVLKPKMHQLNPEQHPKAKGAVYSRMNRQKKKAELIEAKLETEKAKELIQFLRDRMNVRDGVIRQIVGSNVVEDIVKEDAKLYKERFPENC